MATSLISIRLNSYTCQNSLQFLCWRRRLWPWIVYMKLVVIICSSTNKHQVDKWFSYRLGVLQQAKYNRGSVFFELPETSQFHPFHQHGLTARDSAMYFCALREATMMWAPVGAPQKPRMASWGIPQLWTSGRESQFGQEKIGTVSPKAGCLGAESLL